MFKLKIDARKEEKIFVKESLGTMFKILLKIGHFAHYATLKWEGGGGNGCHPSCSSWRLTQI